MSRFEQSAINAVLLLGPTGSGKTPLGECLENKGLKDKRCIHFDFGHQLRSLAGCETPPAAFTAGEHSFVREVIHKGLLLENEHFSIAKKMITSFLEQKDFRGSDLLILNGLPRHTDQAKDLDRFVDIGAVVVLECLAEDVVKRIDSNAGGDRTGRVDDGMEMITKKLEIYHARTFPLIDHYGSNGCRIFRIAVGPHSRPDDIHASIASEYV